MSVYKCSFRIYIIFYHRRPFNKTAATLVRPHLFSTLCTNPLGKMTLWYTTLSWKRLLRICDMCFANPRYIGTLQSSASAQCWLFVSVWYAVHGCCWQETHSAITGMPQLQYVGKDVTKMLGVTRAGLGQVTGGGCLLPCPALPVAGHKT